MLAKVLFNYNYFYICKIQTINRTELKLKKTKNSNLSNEPAFMILKPMYIMMHR